MPQEGSADIGFELEKNGVYGACARYGEANS
jgi:hypothetical protein